MNSSILAFTSIYSSWNMLYDFANPHTVGKGRTNLTTHITYRRIAFKHAMLSVYNWTPTYSIKAIAFTNAINNFMKIVQKGNT